MRGDPAATSATASPGRRWEVTRVGLSGTYLLGGLVHVALGGLAPGAYARFAEQALVGVYTDLWTWLVVPNLWVLHPLVTVFELGLGIVLLWRGRPVRAAHAAGAVFQVGLVLSGPWGPINAVLALIHLLALGHTYPRSVVELVRRPTETEGVA